MPGTASSSWPVYVARVQSVLRHPDLRTIVAFWFLGQLLNLLQFENALRLSNCEVFFG